jgi:predicted TIM-barrel fold metal-dependent hydrolase
MAQHADRFWVAGRTDKLVMTREDAMWDLISVDDHLIEHANVWRDRLPSKYRDCGPHVVEAGGREYWEYEDQREETMGLNAVVGKPGDQWSKDPIRFSDMLPGCYDPKARAKDLSIDNIIGSLCFPTLPGFSGTLFVTFKDKELALECVRAYNDFVLDEWCAAAPGLFIPLVILPLWDPYLASEEALRCAQKGARAVSMPENTVQRGLPSYHTDHWDPVWRVMSDAEMPVCLHIGTSGQISHAPEGARGMSSVMLIQLNAFESLINLLLTPIPHRFENLKFVMSEGGIGWIPAALERADRTWLRHSYDRGETRLPSETFHQSFYGCFVDDRVGIELREHLGVDRIMWECDYPHAEAPWPTAQQTVEKCLVGVPQTEAELMTCGNARRVFRWPAK